MSRSRGGTAVLAAGLFIVALWASTSGSVRIWTEPLEGGPGVGELQVDTAPDDTATERAEPVDTTPPEPDDGLAAILETILLGLLVALAVAAAAALRRPWRLTWRGHDERNELQPTLPDLAEVVTDDADEQLEALAAGTPRNAIVACWVRLEDAVTAAGLEPNRAETPAELTARVLSRYAVGRAAIDELAELYREARFSTHELGEGDRERAVRALRRLHDDLRSGRSAAPT